MNTNRKEPSVTVRAMALNYKVVTKDTVKYLESIPAHFEVVEETTYVYRPPKCQAMKWQEKPPRLLPPPSSLVANIMNAKYVNRMPLARQEREFAPYDLNLSTKTMANWIILCASPHLQHFHNFKSLS